MLLLIGLDLDGTLLGGTVKGHSIMPEAVSTLNQARKAGTQVALVTGRDFPFIEALVAKELGSPEAFGWPQFIIASEREIYVWDGSVWRPDEAWNSSIIAKETEHYEAVSEGFRQLEAERLADLDPAIDRLDWEPGYMRGFVELRFCTADVARAGASIIKEWLDEKGLPYRPVRNKRIVAIRHNEVGKGAVLGRLSRSLGIEPHQVLAMGDSSNDLCMVDGRFGFNGATTGNAEPEIKEAVTKGGGYVAEAGFGGGVAEAVDRWLKEAKTQSVG